MIEVLSGASLSLVKGSYRPCCPSGAGKTTLLNMAGMLERPDEGGVYIRQVATSGLPERRRTKLRGLHIGLCFSFTACFPNLAPWKILLLRK